MKKLSIVLLTILMVFTFTSCDSQSKGTSDMDLIMRIDDAVCRAEMDGAIYMDVSSDRTSMEVVFNHEYKDDKNQITIIGASGNGLRVGDEVTEEYSYDFIDNIDNRVHNAYLKQTILIKGSSEEIKEGIVKLDGKIIGKR